MSKFRNKYRIESIRLPHWDYSWNAAYYITICTKDRQHFFGEIFNAEMILTDAGINAFKFWYDIPNHFPFILLDAFVVMPNHIHGILIINKNNNSPDYTKYRKMKAETSNLDGQTPKLGVSSSPSKLGGKRPEWKPGTLGVILNQYKRICTIHSRKTLPEFAWQPRYHDRIIRDSASFYRIRKYIIDNPKNW